MCVLLKRGAKGAVFVSAQGEVVRQSAMRLEDAQVVDTTGAGDCFTGAFTVELIRQQKMSVIWSKKAEKEVDAKLRLEAVAKAMKFACCAGGLSVQQKGAMGGIPVLKDVMSAVMDMK